MPAFQRCCSFATGGLADQKVQAIAPHAWTNGMRLKRRPSDRPKSPFSLGADITVVLINDTAHGLSLFAAPTAIRLTYGPLGSSRRPPLVGLFGIETVPPVRDIRPALVLLRIDSDREIDRQAHRLDLVTAIGLLVIKVGLVLKRIGLELAGVERGVRHHVVRELDPLGYPAPSSRRSASRPRESGHAAPA
jgi:hypothetical protein